MSQALTNEVKRLRAEVIELRALVREIVGRELRMRDRVDTIEETYARKRGPKPGERAYNGSETQTTVG